MKITEVMRSIGAADALEFTQQDKQWPPDMLYNSMVVEDDLVPNRQQGICSSHADFIQCSVSYW